MPYSVRDRSFIISTALSIFRKRLENAINSDSLNDFLDLLGIDLDETSNPVYASYDRHTKILVLGGLAGKKVDYILCAKKLGIDEQNLEFHDYEEMKSFNIDNLRYSKKISDIICGPIPHKTKVNSDYSSIIARIKDNPNEFHKVFIATANERLKLTINNFKEGLSQTRYKDKFS